LVAEGGAGFVAGDGVAAGDVDQEEGAGEGDVEAGAVEGFAAALGEVVEGETFDPEGVGEGGEVGGKVGAELGDEEEAGVGEGAAEAGEALAHVAFGGVVEE
jgi:hypothetical protein